MENGFIIEEARRKMMSGAADGEIIEGTVLGKWDILAVNNSFDGFAEYARNRGVQVKRDFI